MSARTGNVARRRSAERSMARPADSRRRPANETRENRCIHARGMQSPPLASPTSLATGRCRADPRSLVGRGRIGLG